MSHIEAVFFDIDGTLVDSNDLHVDAWDEVFREAGNVIPRDTIHGQIGKGGDNLLPALLPDIGSDAQERLANRHGDVFKSRYIERVKPFPGARDLLARAKAEGLKVALASSAGSDEVDHYLDLLDARDIVDFSTSKDDAEHSKPDPGIFAAALKKSGASADSVIVIGDTPYDVEAATKLGIGSIGLLSGGFPEASLKETGALAVYCDVAHLLADYDGSPLA
jgi:HAD superfamily hydrolase (TIGR01509 family)